MKGVALIGVEGRDMAGRVLWRCHKILKCQHNLFPESPELPGETGSVLYNGHRKESTELWELEVVCAGNALQD